MLASIRVYASPVAVGHRTNVFSITVRASVSHHQQQPQCTMYSPPSSCSPLALILIACPHLTIRSSQARCNNSGQDLDECGPRGVAFKRQPFRPAVHPFLGRDCNQFISLLYTARHTRISETHKSTHHHVILRTRRGLSTSSTWRRKSELNTTARLTMKFSLPCALKISAYEECMDELVCKITDLPRAIVH